MSAARLTARSRGWLSVLLVAVGCSTVPTLSTQRADAGGTDTSVPDVVTKDVAVEDTPTPTVDAPDPYGQCGEMAYQALCACTTIADVAELGRCQQRVFARFPECSRCLSVTISRGCCEETYEATQACATTHACGDQPCIDAHCGEESAAFIRCQMTAQALPSCQAALRVCIADFPRLMMCP